MNSAVSHRIFVASLVVAGALTMTAIVWWPLWRGGGFVGGDVYSYYFPQKVVYAEALRAGELPYWNNRAGHGYPFVAESQTGPFYPLNLLLYRLLEVNAAYNINHLLHYVLAFCFTWLLARRLGLGFAAAGLAALVYTYGWFPARSCWEWAIIGGAWLPAALWCVESFLQTRFWRYAFGLTAVLALQLFAGHFNLAFITQVTIVVWVGARLWFARDRLPPGTISCRARCTLMLAVACVCAFTLSAVQIWPTWELKSLSQRAAPGENHKLAHGSIPAWYWSQTFLPWKWYAVDFNRDAELDKSEPSLGAPTNQVEAHLYFGLVPLALAVVEIVQGFRTRNRERVFWTLLGLAALLYTSGWLLPIARHLPGFSFFQGPGRWGVLTTLMVGLLAGNAVDRFRASRSIPMAIWIALALSGAMLSTLILAASLLQAYELQGFENPLRFGPLSVSDNVLSMMTLAVIIASVGGVLLLKFRSRDGKRESQGDTANISHGIFAAAILVVTLVDLWLVGHLVHYSEMVPDPPINHLAESPVRKILSPFGGSARLLAPSANLPSVLGAAATPVYLTFGPAAYVDPQLTMPRDESSEQIAWLQRAGVTHVLSFEPLKGGLWPVAIVWQGYDPMFNPAIARREPLYLFKLLDSRGRVAWADPESKGTAKVVELTANRVQIEADSETGGKLILTDLMYPGWEVSIDEVPADAETFESMFRAVQVPAGKHEVAWTYRPRGIYWSAVLGLFTFVLLAAVAHVRFWHPQRCRFLDEETGS